jgi:predicted CopG family antitoxin
MSTQEQQTTIMIDRETHERLEGRKVYDRETFDSVVRKLLSSTDGGVTNGNP